MAKHSGTIESVRFLKRKDLIPEMKLQEEYFREVIQEFGVDVIYFRHDQTYEDSKKDIYGEKPDRSYTIGKPMVVFIEMEGDARLLSKFGFETDSDCKIFLMMSDFSDSFRDVLGSSKTFFCDDINKIALQGEIQNWEGSIRGDVKNDELNGFVINEFSITPDTLPEELLNLEFLSEYQDIPVIKNPFIAKQLQESYPPRKTDGELSGEYSCFINKNGNGYCSGFCNAGEIQYLSTKTDKYGKFWDVAPQVGDFFRLDFDQENFEEYEVTAVINKNLQNDGLNPLLFRYIWQLSAVQRDTSYENVVDVPESELDNFIEPSVIGKLQHGQNVSNKMDISIAEEKLSNDIFDYHTEIPDQVIDNTVDADLVYGGYEQDPEIFKEEEDDEPNEYGN